MQSPNPKIYGHFDRLVPIVVRGRTFQVPEGVPLIRALQFIEFELGGLKCDWSLFCFNDTIGCCETTLAAVGEAPMLDRACCRRVEAGLVIHELPEGCRLLDPSEAADG